MLQFPLLLPRTLQKVVDGPRMVQLREPVLLHLGHNLLHLPHGVPRVLPVHQHGQLLAQAYKMTGSPQVAATAALLTEPQPIHRPDTSQQSGHTRQAQPGHAVVVVDVDADGCRHPRGWGLGCPA